MIWVTIVSVAVMAYLIGLFMGAFYVTTSWQAIAGMGYMEFKKAKSYVDETMDLVEKIEVDFTDVDRLLEALEVCEQHDSLDVFITNEVYDQTIHLLGQNEEYEWIMKLKNLRDEQ
jgi:hypothetical protein